MGDKNSKLPDLKEIGGMAGKLFKDIKSSVTEIVNDYKSKRTSSEASAGKDEVKEESAKVKPEKEGNKDKAEGEKGSPKTEKTDSNEDKKDE